jgi:hypothetical protein
MSKLNTERLILMQGHSSSKLSLFISSGFLLVSNCAKPREKRIYVERERESKNKEWFSTLCLSVGWSVYFPNYHTLLIFWEVYSKFYDNWSHRNSSFLIPFHFWSFSYKFLFFSLWLFRFGLFRSVRVWMRVCASMHSIFPSFKPMNIAFLFSWTHSRARWIHFFKLIRAIFFQFKTLTFFKRYRPTITEFFLYLPAWIYLLDLFFLFFE